MNLIYASLLLHSAGKDITEENVKKIADATGVAVEPAQIKALVAALKGVNIAETISKAALPVAVAAPTQATAQAAEKDEPSAEDLEKKSEEAAAGLSALFG